MIGALSLVKKIKESLDSFKSLILKERILLHMMNVEEEEEEEELKELFVFEEKREPKGILG